MSKKIRAFIGYLKVLVNGETLGGGFYRFLSVHACFLVFYGLPHVFINTMLLGQTGDVKVVVMYNATFFLGSAAAMLLAAGLLQRTDSGVTAVLGILGYNVLYLLLIVLPVVAFVVLRQRQLPEERGDIEPKKQMAIVYLAALVVGAYDGFYGPGTGTFLLLIFCNLGKLDVRTAGGNVKLVNLSSNIASLLTSLLSGKVFLVLGLIGTVSSILGHFIGAGLAIKNGSKIVKPAIILVLILLAAKVVQGLIAG